MYGAPPNMSKNSRDNQGYSGVPGRGRTQAPRGHDSDPNEATRSKAEEDDKGDTGGFAYYSLRIQGRSGTEIRKVATATPARSRGLVG